MGVMESVAAVRGRCWSCHCNRQASRGAGL